MAVSPLAQQKFFDIFYMISSDFAIIFSYLPMTDVDKKMVF